MSTDDLLEEIEQLKKKLVEAEAFRNPVIGDWWREQGARADAAEKALADERKMKKHAVKSAFEEGFVAGTNTGWWNNPRMSVEWKKSNAKRGLKDAHG